jgi:hypothetical protein
MIRLLSDLDKRLLRMEQGTGVDQVNRDFLHECERSGINAPEAQRNGDIIGYKYFDNFHVAISSTGMQLNLGPTKAAAVANVVGVLLFGMRIAEEARQQDGDGSSVDLIDGAFVDACNEIGIDIPAAHVQDDTVQYLYRGNFRVVVSSGGLQLSLSDAHAAAHGIRFLLFNGGFIDPNGDESDTDDYVQAAEDRLRGDAYDSGDDTPPHSP